MDLLHFKSTDGGGFNDCSVRVTVIVSRVNVLRGAPFQQFSGNCLENIWKAPIYCDNI